MNTPTMVKLKNFVLHCGASSGMQSTSAAQNALFSTLTTQASGEFTGATTAFNDLMGAFSPIVAAGPSQQGYSAGQLENMNSQTITSEGIAARNAKQTTGEELSAVGGGNTTNPSGLVAGVDSGINEQFAQNTASGLSQNLKNDYAQGNENWKEAAAGVESAPGVFGTANSAGTSATGSGSSAFGSENSINQSNQSWMQLASGALGDVASVATAGVGKGGAFNPNA